MVSLTVAMKMLANRVKGNVAFKPDHGEHGQCSWFISSGNPYTGVTPGKDIQVVVDVDPSNVVTDDKIVNETLASMKEHDAALRQSNRRAFDLKLWNSVGSQLRVGRPAVCSNVRVPQGELSQQGGGYFLVVPPLAASKVSVVNWKDLEVAVALRRPNFLSTYILAEEAKNLNLSAQLSIEIGPCDDPGKVDLCRRTLVQGGGRPTKFNQGPTTTRTVSIPSGWNGQTKNVPRYFASDQLVYAGFREARNAFKTLVQLASAINAKAATQGMFVKVFGGDNWNAKQSSVYTAPGQARQSFAR